MVKNGLNSLRNSTSNLSLRPTPSEAELNAAARQRMADLEARIAQMTVGHEGRARSSAAEPSAPSFYPSMEQSRALQADIDARSGSRAGESSAPSSSFYPSPEQSRALQADINARSGPRAGEPAPSSSFYPSPEQSRALQADVDARSGSRAAESSVSLFPRVRFPGIAKDLEALRTYRDCGYAYPQHSTATTYPAPPPHFFPPPLPCPSRMSAPFGALSPWAERDVPANKETPEKSLFEKYNESLQEQHNKPKGSLITKGLVREGNALKSPEAYTQPFCDFLTENPTVWHAVAYFEKKLEKAGFKKLSERKTWNDELQKGGKYFVSRNGSSLIAFTIGGGYKSGNGVAMIAGHVDALTARLKPVSNKRTAAGYVQLGVAPYAGALNPTWWDRDLGVGGRVLVKDSTGKINTKLVKLGWPIARIPTLAPHFGVGMFGANNSETQAVPIIGLDNSDIVAGEEFKNLTLGGEGTFSATQPPKLVRTIASELGIQDYSSIVNWELELFDTQPAQVGGLDKEFIFAGRIDDKLCSWSAMEGLLASAAAPTSEDDGIVKLVGVFDDEEIGSLLRQGARGNFLPGTVERISESFAKGSSANVLSQTYANSFLISADVTHAVNPNFLGSYLDGHAPRLNVGLVVCADSNGHMTTDSVSTTLLTRIAEQSDSRLQLFMIRNDSRSGGTVGPMLSSAMGVRAIDAGIPQLSMHSIRATTGALDPGLGVKVFKGFFDNFESVDKKFE